MNLDEKVNVFVATHKPITLDIPECYRMLMLGAKSRGNVPDGYFRDDAGDNISIFNPSFSELTGLYWIWKNVKSKYVGLVHYRRFFAHISKNVVIRKRYITLSRKNKYMIYDRNDYLSCLLDCDMIVKSNAVDNRVNGEIFCSVLGGDFWNLIRKYFFDKYIACKSVFSEVEKSKRHANCNMFFGKKDIVDDYCAWVFPILSDIYDIHMNMFGEKCMSREMGYIPEFLFQVWLDYNQINYVYKDVVNTAGLFGPEEAVFLGDYIMYNFKKLGERLRNEEHY